MKRREFIAGTGMLIGTAYVPSVSTADDETAVKQAVKDVYSIFYVSLDKQKYRSLLTEDYLLLENGELLDIEGDIALMPGPESGYKRTDAFDFRSVKVYGDTAYAVYFPEVGDNGQEGRESQPGVARERDPAALGRRLADGALTLDQDRETRRVNPPAPPFATHVAHSLTIIRAKR